MFEGGREAFGASGRTRHAYVVDDDPHVRRALYLLLSAANATHVRAFASGDAFLQRLPDLDAGCVVLDLDMPGANGADVMAHLRGDAEPWAAVVLTGAVDVPMAVRLVQAGAVDVLEKPADAATIRAAVARGFDVLEAESARRDRVREAAGRLNALSKRERDVLAGLIEGRPNKVIAHTLGLSPRTVEVHRANVMTKLGARSLSDAFRLAMAAGMSEAAKI